MKRNSVNKNLEEIYTDYLMVSTGECTATGLSRLSGIAVNLSNYKKKRQV